MKKDEILEVAGMVGKGLVRSVMGVGTQIATIGGGIMGTMYYASLCKHKWTQIPVIVIGALGSYAAGVTMAGMVDDKLVEIGLDIDGC